MLSGDCGDLGGVRHGLPGGGVWDGKGFNTGDTEEHRVVLHQRITRKAGVELVRKVFLVVLSAASAEET